MASASTELVRPDIFDPTPIIIPKAEKAGILARQFDRAAKRFQNPPPGNLLDFAYEQMAICGRWLIDARREGHIADNRPDLAKLTQLIDWHAAQPNRPDCNGHNLFFDFSGAFFNSLSAVDKDGNERPFGQTPEGFTMFRINNGHRDLSMMERLAATCEYIASIIEADAGDESDREDVIDTSQLISFARVSRMTLHRWRKEGLIPEPFAKVGRSSSWRWSEVRGPLSELVPFQVPEHFPGNL